MPRLSNFRHFRFKQMNGKTWRKVPERIKTKGELQKWILKLGGVDLYYSTSAWLNPQKVSTKGDSGTYIVSDNLILWNDLVFDIDAKEPIKERGLDLARKSTWNLYQGMKKYEDRFEFKYCAFTGYKGFRLVYQDKQTMPENARARLDYIENNRKIFIVKLLKDIKSASKKTKLYFYKLEPFFDEKITINPLCVIRVLGSVHSSTGFISTKIKPDLLRKPIKELIKHIPHICKRRPGISVKREMTPSDRYPCPRLLNHAKDVSGLASLQFLFKEYRYYLTNKVLGIKKGFIPIFIYQDNQKYYKKEVISLQNKYNLGPIFIFESYNTKVIFALKTMQRKQLLKVLNTSSSKSKNDFKKHKRIFAPFFMNLKEVIPYKYTGHLSKGHSIMFKEYHKVSSDLCGWPKVELIRAYKEKQNGNI
jgi:DNA primase catalytic subunit